QEIDDTIQQLPAFAIQRRARTIFFSHYRSSALVLVSRTDPACGRLPEGRLFRAGSAVFGGL
ncbi:MAG: hypothetical protein M3545_10005, partial [Acidobacteriota bacterium]|nr:hypothetical protein [Acidobacteriota bacterium]